MSVRVDGKRLDNFTEVASVEGLKDGTTIELVEGECQVVHGGGGIERTDSMKQRSSSCPASSTCCVKC